MSNEQWRFFFFIYLAFICYGHSDPVERNADYLTVENGLLNNYVNSIFQDHQGFLWFGTDEGLSRYDGYEFINLIHDSRDTNSLSHNIVNYIFEDSYQQLWVSTRFGLNRLINEQQGFVRYFSSTEDSSSLSDSEVFCIYEDRDHNLWIGTSDGVLNLYHEDTDQFSRFPPPNKKPHLSSITEDKHGNLILGYGAWKHNPGEGGVGIFDKCTKRYLSEALDKLTQNLAAREIIVDQEDILPPWWKSGWAYAFYTLLLVGLIVAVRQTAIYRSSLLNAVQIERIELKKTSELSRMKTKFFTNIFHEFKTPLTLILGPLEKIRTSGPLRPDLQKQFFIMQHNAKRLLRLINLLVLSQKNEFVGIQLQANKTDLVAFIENIVRAFRNRAKEQQIDLIFEPSEDSLKLWFDREKLDMVFYNLLSNAFKNTNPGGTIEISFMRETVELENAVIQEWITIDIQDTGRGIAPEKLDKVFDSFYKADETIPGTGIGLSFSKSIVDLHRGEMSATSELGKGSCFTVCLLLGDKHLQAEEMIPPSQNLRADSTYVPQDQFAKTSFMDVPIPELSIKKNNKPTILVVEDEYDVLAFLRENLLTDYEIVVAFDGQEGLKKANQCDPDLIISDIMMPRMDGIEFCTKIKSNLSTSHIPIIFLTAQSSDEALFKGLDSGADDFIAKPFNLRVLETKINNIIITRQMLKERFKKELAFGIEEITITSLDEQFISTVVKLIEENISNPEFNVDSIIGKVSMSRSPFFRKIKAITGQTPSEFLRFFKLKRGAQVLLQSGKTIAQVAYEMGYSSPKIFRAHFKKQFGQTPSEYIKAYTYQEERVKNTN